MKKRIQTNGRRKGADTLHTLRRIRKTTDNVIRALDTVRRARETEHKKALLCAMQRDFYSSLVDYFDEYVMLAAQTEEQLKEAKQNYKSFAQKKARIFFEESRPLIDAIYEGKKGAYLAKRCAEPYHILEPERMELADEAERRMTDKQ